MCVQHFNLVEFIATKACDEDVEEFSCKTAGAVTSRVHITYPGCQTHEAYFACMSDVRQ